MEVGYTTGVVNTQSACGNLIKQLRKIFLYINASLKKARAKLSI